MSIGLRQHLNAKNKSHDNILELHQNINRLIDLMDVKIEDAIYRHESEFRLAYRSHSKKVQLELQQMKHKMQEQYNQNYHVRKIASLQKQLSLFRDEALIVYQKYESKEIEVQKYKARVSELERQVKFLQIQVKKLMKQVKVRQTKKILELDESINQFQSSLQKAQTKPTTAPYKFKRSKVVNRSVTEYISHSNQKLNVCFEGNDRYKEQVKKQGTVDRDRRYSALSQKYNKLIKQMAQSNNQLQKIFESCVEVAKRQFFNRQNIQVGNEDMQYERFKRKDKIQILKSFVCNQAVIKIIYNLMFKDSIFSSQKPLVKKYNSFMM